MTTPQPDIYTDCEQAMDALDAERISHGLTRGILLCASQPEPAGEAVAFPCEAFERAMVEAGYELPKRGTHDYLYELDSGMFVGWKLALEAHPPAAAPAPAQDPSEMTLRDYAEAFFKAGHDFWKACRRDAGGGAVRWLSCDDGTLIVFTRGEYREAIMGAVGGYRATEVVFEDQGSDEQNGMVACAAPAQEVGLTEAERVRCLIASGCIGTVKMTYDSGPYEITRTSINASRLIDAIIAALRAKGQV